MRTCRPIDLWSDPYGRGAGGVAADDVWCHSRCTARWTIPRTSRSRSFAPMLRFSGGISLVSVGDRAANRPSVDIGYDAGYPPENW